MTKTPKELGEMLKKAASLGRDEILRRGYAAAPQCHSCGEKIWAGEAIAFEGLFKVHARCLRAVRIL